MLNSYKLPNSRVSNVNESTIDVAIVEGKKKKTSKSKSRGNTSFYNTHKIKHFPITNIIPIFSR